MTTIDIMGQYLATGFKHVLPYGFDHILFILSLFFLDPKLRSVIIQCSCFTIAHSVTLGLSAAGYLSPDARIIEPLIALSILFTSLENIVHSKVNTYRLLIIFAFGLVHGMGFATALTETGIPHAQFLPTLIAFNTGVELAQLAILLMAYYLVAKWFSSKPWYKERIVYPVSSIIGSIALYWTIERILI